MSEMFTAAKVWYGSTDRGSCCKAEVRLMKGEKPIENFSSVSSRTTDDGV